MATVTGVTEETTVTMETASQRAIFEASKEKHAPSLIAACARGKSAVFSCLTCMCVCVSICVCMSLTDNETLTVGWPPCVYMVPFTHEVG